MLEPVLEHFQLQRAHRAEDGVLHAQSALREDLDRAFLAELEESLLQLLALERVLAADPGEDLRREAGQLGELEGRAFAQCVADAQRPGVEQTDDVARPGFLDDLALRSEELVGHGEAQAALLAHVPHLHAAAEAATADAQEGQAVAVRGVHVRLDLEDEPAEALVGRIDRPAARAVAWRGRRGKLHERGEELVHADLRPRRAEEGRGLLAAQDAGVVERIPGVRHELDLVRHVRAQLGVHGGQLRHDAAPAGVQLGEERRHAREVRALADRPGDRHGADPEHLLDFVEQVDRLAPGTVQLVDEGEDGDAAAAADLEQLLRLRLDSLGGVDQHHRRVRRGQRAVGVLGKVLVAGRVEQVELEPAPVELQHARGDGDAALPLQLHPVAGDVAGLAARLDRPGQVDGSSMQEELLGQRRLSRVGVRDDREGAPAQDFAAQLVPFCLVHPRCLARGSVLPGLNRTQGSFGLSS